jgi:hypothetical protein
MTDDMLGEFHTIDSSISRNARFANTAQTVTPQLLHASIPLMAAKRTEYPLLKTHLPPYERAHESSSGPLHMSGITPHHSSCHA